MANSISRLKGTDSTIQWSQKVNFLIDSLELYMTTAGSFTSAVPSISDLVVYDSGWKNKTLIAGDVVFDTSYYNTALFKIKLDNIAITGKTELTLVDTAADFLLIYDDSAALLKKVKPQYIVTAATTPGGLNTQLQFNDSGVFNGDAGLTYNKTTDTLTIVGGLIVDTNTLFVDYTNNRVGILTIVPAYVLDVVGDVNTSTIYRIGGNSVLSSVTLGPTVVNSSLTSVGILSTLAVAGAVTLSSSVTALSLNVTNNVGIGTVDPTYKLHVVGTGYISGGLTANVTGNASTATALQNARTIAGASFDGTANIAIASTGLSDTAGIVRGAAALTTVGAIPYVSAAGMLSQDSPGMHWDATINLLGLGTAAPVVPLHIVGNVNQEVARFQSNGNILLRSYISLFNSNADYWWEFSVQDSAGGGTTNGLSFRERSVTGASISRLYIAQGGNVGIGTGTASPAATLDIVGTLKVSSGITSTAGVSDTHGNLRNVPQNAQATAYTLVEADNGRHISITTGGVVVPAAVFSAGQSITIFNNSTATQTITQGASVTIYLAGSATTGNRSLAQRGLTTILCVASNTFVITGAGVS